MDRKIITDKEVKGICRGASYEDGVIFCDALEGVDPPTYKNHPFKTCSPKGICIATKFHQELTKYIPDSIIERMNNCQERGKVNQEYEYTIKIIRTKLLIPKYSIVP